LIKEQWVVDEAGSQLRDFPRQEQSKERACV
jgi:hypothetical protein